MYPQDIGQRRSRRRIVIAAAAVVYLPGCRELGFGGGGTECSQIKSLTTGSRRVSVSRSPRNALAMRMIHTKNGYYCKISNLKVGLTKK